MPTGDPQISAPVPPLSPLLYEQWSDGRCWERPRWRCRWFGHLAFLERQRGWYFLRCRRCGTRSDPQPDAIEALIVAGQKSCRCR